MATSAQLTSPVPRILCLHGKGDTSQNFEQRIAPLGTLAEVVCIDAPHPLGRGYAWWYLKEGERSFNAKEFEGWEQSVSTVKEAWAQGRFDGILGFSQGAILLAACVATGALKVKASSGEQQVAPQPKFMILAGSALPGPFLQELESYGTERSKAGSSAVDECAMLHIIGRNDSINPAEHAEKIQKSIGGEIYYHDGDHDIPVDEASLDQYAAFLKKIG